MLASASRLGCTCNASMQAEVENRLYSRGRRQALLTRFLKTKYKFLAQSGRVEGGVVQRLEGGGGGDVTIYPRFGRGRHKNSPSRELI